MAVKSSNPLKRMIKPLVSPAVYDFWARKLLSNAAWETPLATVVERHVEARDSVTLLLRPHGHFDGFLPGQHVNVTIAVEGVRHTRSYSLTDVPRKDGLLSITVKRVGGGKVSTELCQHTRVGDVLELGQAFGDLTAPADYQGNWLFLAAGSGITPIISLIRSLSLSTLKQNVTLLYWARTRADLCFFQELRELSAREPRFHLHFVLTREHELLPNDSQGRPSLALFEQLVPSMAEQRAYACGPAGFVESVQELIAARVGFFASEAFTPSTMNVVDMGKVTVTLRSSQRQVEVATDKPLLAALEDAGIKPAAGCRMGICNTCACEKSAGVSEDLLTGDVDADVNSALRICVNAARSDITLDL